MNTSIDPWCHHAISAGVTDINPASGLPMISGIGGVDVAGNPYGTDLHHHDQPFDSGIGSCFDTGIGSCFDSGAGGGIGGGFL